jgi:hypothetical protein
MEAHTPCHQPARARVHATAAQRTHLIQENARGQHFDVSPEPVRQRERKRAMLPGTCHAPLAATFDNVIYRYRNVPLFHIYLPLYMRG